MFYLKNTSNVLKAVFMTCSVIDYYELIINLILLYEVLLYIY